METLESTALQNIKSILKDIFQHQAPYKAILVYDNGAALSKLLAETYRQALPKDLHLDYDALTPEKILEEINALSPGNLVILVQSSSFRLDAFRIRVHLFKQGLKVIEHPHLGRVLDSEIPSYIHSLAYDRDYYLKVGHSLKKKLDAAQRVTVKFGDSELIYNGPFEESKLNIGDFSQLKNVGSQFPIGEVFSELKDLTKLNGKVSLFAFGDRIFSVYDATANPVLVTIQEGRVVKVENSNEEFDAVLEDIRAHEKEIWVRELGFGMNKAFTRQKQIRRDVGIYERMCGVHLSLGSKHALYPKEGFRKKDVKYHVDVFAEVDVVEIDNEIIFEKGAYVL